MESSIMFKTRAKSLSAHAVWRHVVEAVFCGLGFPLPSDASSSRSIELLAEPTVISTSTRADHGPGVRARLQEALSWLRCRVGSSALRGRCNEAMNTCMRIFASVMAAEVRSRCLVRPGWMGRAPGAFIGLLVLCSGPVAAQAIPVPSSAPVLRIDPGAHTAMVRATAFDAQRERVYTASDDKTVRIWQLPAGKLVNTLRVPIQDGPEGQLYALALSPDGRWLAVGGWTGWEWEQRASVYIFDTQTEQLAQRLPVAPWTITNLRFSPDGEHLAVGMHGQGGLVIVRLASGQVIAADPAYQNNVMDMDFDRFGRLHAVGLDGFIRLYKQDFTLLARRAVQVARDPVALRVSPDGERLAVGFADAPVIEVVNARDLSTLGVLRAERPRQKDFVAVGWGRDGRQLFGSGDEGSAASSVHRWNVPSQPGAPMPVGERAKVVSATHGRINDLWPLSQGRMLFVSDAPSVGWIDADGQVNEPITSAQWNFALPDTRLLISPSGDQVRISSGGRSARFGVSTARVDWQSGAAAAGLRDSQTKAAGWSFELASDQRSLRLNRQDVALEEYEKVRSHAFLPDRSAVVVGTEWALRSYDARGGLRWLTRVSSPVWKVNVSADGRVVVAAIGDGTLRWFSADTGKELLSVFLHRNASDWIAWLPEGYYTSSPYGDKHIGWHLNRGLDLSPDFVYAVQLERVLYRPDLVRAALDTRTGVENSIGVPVARMTNEQMHRMAPPRLRLTLKGVDAGKAVARLVVEAEQTGPEMRDVALYVNDIPVTATRDRELHGQDTQGFKREYEVPLSQRVNTVRVETFTGLSMGLASLQVDLPAEASLPQAKGDLYVLAIGASKFSNLPKDAWLAFAAKDADVFASTLNALPANQYRQRHVKVLTDSADLAPTRSNILSALEFLKSAKAQDTVVMFLASHGVSDERGNYYFVPSDTQPDDFQGLHAVSNPQSLLSWQVFFDVLRVVAGQRILVVDTCQARGIAGHFDPHSLIKRSASSQFALMLASGAEEASQEYDPAGHGLFTYGLLSSLKTAQAGSTGTLRLGEWFTETARVVQQFRDRSIGPQNPQFLAPDVLAQTVVLTRHP
jgi:WD40 repeat protein